jgi:hypothetical protein
MAQTPQPTPTQEPPAKETLIRRLAERLNLDHSKVEGVVDGTISELFVPSTLTELAAAGGTTNNCTNNCRRPV